MPGTDDSQPLAVIQQFPVAQPVVDEIENLFLSRKIGGDAAGIIRRFLQILSAAFLCSDPTKG